MDVLVFGILSAIFVDFLVEHSKNEFLNTQGYS
jgi:hypothetical protein